MGLPLLVGFAFRRENDGPVRGDCPGVERDPDAADFFSSPGGNRYEFSLLQEPVHQHGLFFRHKASWIQGAINGTGTEWLQGQLVHHFTTGLKERVVKVAQNNGFIHR
ncbi:hypothetical protein AC77_5375 [Escherichia coli 5-366-08_S4_C1]|uniref:Uncharacterized protein n=1 Tax=Salmonella typhimurium TaxID=90371 RepID=A0A345WZH4_SALTM|nr:hypothetical protein [Salmonella enterica subsp. enterica serovar Typhimurium]KEO39718.1 hypothetical protein AC77_5375 [Escherichia coli 5-366-08_S4_C1]